MVSPGLQSLKLLLTFAAATSGAVLVAVQMHHSGVPMEKAQERAQVPPPLPTLRDGSMPMQPRPAPKPPLSKAAEPVPEPEPIDSQADDAVPVAIPVVAAQLETPMPEPVQAKVEPVDLLATQSLAASASLPVVDAIPVSVAMLAAKPEYQPFVDSLTETMRQEAPKAVPLPMVYQAVIMNDNEWLRQLLKAGFAVNDPTPFGETALCAAIKARNQEALELLLLHGADPKLPGRDGQAPLAIACLMRTERAIPALLSAGADANTTYQAPLSDEMLKGVAAVELRNSLREDRGVTVLMAVAARGDTEGTIALMQHGAKPEQSTKRYYRYPINYAAEEGYLFIMRLLLGRPADSEPDVLVTIDLSQQKAYLSQFGEIIDKTTVSTGREGYDTPEGRYLVTDKHSSWTSTIYHVEMPWFMRLNCSAIGLHAGYVTGEPASHGCIRLPYDKVKKWFGIVKVGDEVQIVR